MILLVNGDSHTAGAEALNSYAFAEDDPRYVYQGRKPHPDNIKVSWGYKLAGPLKAKYHCLAESASSNDRIIRTTRTWLENNPANEDRLLIIQWSTWERQEWLIDNVYFQVNASGIDDVPESHQDKYKKFVAKVDWQEATKKAHNKIWQFHLELQEQNIKHVFFNGNSHFSDISDRKEWGTSYIGPYDYKATYDYWITEQGYQKVNPKSYHYGPDAHKAWQSKILHYVIDNELV